MRCNRTQHQIMALRQNNRPVYTHRIAGRPRWRRYQKPVCLIRCQIFIVQKGMNRNHGRGIPFQNSHLIQRIIIPSINPFVRMKAQQRTLLNMITIPKQLIKCIFNLHIIYIRQKAKMPRIHTQYRNILLVHPGCRPQKGTVPP